MASESANPSTPRGRVIGIGGVFFKSDNPALSPTGTANTSASSPISTPASVFPGARPATMRHIAPSGRFFRAIPSILSRPNPST